MKLQTDLEFVRKDQQDAAADYRRMLESKHPELAKPTPGKLRMTDLVLTSHALLPGEADPSWVFGVRQDERGARMVIDRIATAAFGREPSSEQLDGLLNVYRATVDETGDHSKGLRDGLAAVLLSSDFLLRFARGHESEIAALSDEAIAGRLAAFLWLSIPDATLRQMASNGWTANLDAGLEHLIHHHRFDAFCDTFMQQWLDLNALNGLNSTLTAAMRAEPALLLREIIREDKSLLELLDARHSWLNEPLAQHYGVAGVEGLAMRRVELPDQRRGGLLTMGGVLTVTSTEQRTSPVARGAWIVETLLGVDLPPPPPSVPELKQNVQTRTIREELEAHRSSSQCAGCHNRIDPYGFVLENYNRFGIWRDREGLKRVNARSTLDDGTKINGLIEFKRYLREQRATDFVRNVTQRMLEFALGRQVQYHDEALIQHVLRELEADDWRARTLLREIVRSDAFQKQNNSVEAQP